MEGRGAERRRAAHLEEALAALAGAHPVVLAGGVVPAHGARALARSRAPAGRRRQTGALTQEAGRGGRKMRPLPATASQEKSHVPY